MKKYFLMLFVSVALVSCGSGSGDTGHSTPIDSTNVNGTAPATYGGSNPADDTIPKNNVGDTGTKANNVHNTPTQ